MEVYCLAPVERFQAEDGGLTMPERFEKKDFPLGRCNPCEYAKVVIATGQWSFLGCYCNPYRGKWVAEIKDCPKEKKEV